MDLKDEIYKKLGENLSEEAMKMDRFLKDRKEKEEAAALELITETAIEEAREKKDYCAFRDENPNCEECSLVNYGRDCRNNPIKGED